MNKKPGPLSRPRRASLYLVPEQIKPEDLRESLAVEFQAVPLGPRFCFFQYLLSVLPDLCFQSSGFAIGTVVTTAAHAVTLGLFGIMTPVVTAPLDARAVSPCHYGRHGAPSLASCSEIHAWMSMERSKLFCGSVAIACHLKS